MHKALAAALQNAKIVAIPGQDRATRLSPKIWLQAIDRTGHCLHIK